MAPTPLATEGGSAVPGAAPGLQQSMAAVVPQSTTQAMAGEGVTIVVSDAPQQQQQQPPVL